MNNALIFFTDTVEPFQSRNGVRVSPIPCVLTNGTEGYYLGIDWMMEIYTRVSQINMIDKSDIQQDDIISNENTETSRRNRRRNRRN